MTYDTPMGIKNCFPLHALPTGSPTSRPPRAVVGVWRRTGPRWLLAAAFALMAAQPVRAQAVSPVIVPVIVVQPEAAGSQFTLEGSLRALQEATVAAQVPGTVLTLAVKAGDSVRAGQLLARLDAREAEAGVQQAAAALAQAEAAAVNARAHAQRTRDLQRQNFLSPAALDTAEAQLRVAEAAVQQTLAARSQAQLARSFSTINAPFAGVVMATHLDAGDLAAPGRAVLTLVAPGALRAEVQVPGSRAAAARSAQRVEVLLPDGRTVEPLRRQVLALADPVAQTVEWRLDLPPAATEGLLPGQSVQVRFVGADARAATAAVPVTAPLRLPAAAVLRRGELTAVYVAQPEGFTLRAVRLGADHGAGGVEVLAGVRAGERVAADALRAGIAGARPAR